MSARSRSQRLDVLERARGIAAPVFCWINEGETPAQAAARAYPNAKPNAPLLFIGWQSSEGGQA